MLERLLSDLENAPPTYFIVVDNDLNNLQLRTSRDEFFRIEGLTRFMASRYTPETTLEDFELWRLKSDGYRSLRVPSVGRDPGDIRRQRLHVRDEGGA